MRETLPCGAKPSTKHLQVLVPKLHKPLLLCRRLLLISLRAKCAAQEVDPNPQTAELARLEGSAGMLSELAGAIPGIDEAMSFAEVLKQVSVAVQCV